MSKKSIEEVRRNLIERLKEEGLESFDMVVEFTNDDVPKWLEEYEKYKQRCKEIHFRIKSKYEEVPNYNMEK